MKKNNLEIRYITTEIRSVDNESRKISGLAIPSEKRSELLYGEFYETISRDALTEDLIKNNDVKLYLNHNEGHGTYARSKYGEGSLRLFVTDRGIEFSTELPKTVFGDALLEGIRRGDFDALSFAFKPGKDEWQANKDGTYNRTIRSISFLDEISILSCAPAYEQTNVKLRSLEEFKEARLKESLEKIKEQVDEVQERNAQEEKDKELLETLDAKLKEIDAIREEFGV